MSLRSIPPEQMNYDEVIELIKLRIPNIDNEVQRRYVRDVSVSRLRDYSGSIRWRDWSDAIESAIRVTIDQPYLDERKIEILEHVYHHYVRPYVGQFKTKGEAMAEAYIVCKRLCKEWDLPEEKIHFGLKFVDIWDKERSWDAQEFQKN